MKFLWCIKPKEYIIFLANLNIKNLKTKNKKQWYVVLWDDIIRKPAFAHIFKVSKGFYCLVSLNISIFSAHSPPPASFPPWYVSDIVLYCLIMSTWLLRVAKGGKSSRYKESSQSGNFLYTIWLYCTRHCSTALNLHTLE